MTEFALHPQLAADTFWLGDWPLSRVLLMNDRTYPWLVLVPRRSGVRELIDLDDEDRLVAWREIDRAARALRATAEPDKLNIGAIGNSVPQLHVHVVARFATDPAWPKPVWGFAAPRPYVEDARRSMMATLRGALGL
ncbi:MAG: HIT domain-containing protein [Alphaproteobacteria bacterium]|nr:HIT domain-containing protein [Alphaproteobacteria bacterium]